MPDPDELDSVLLEPDGGVLGEDDGDEVDPLVEPDVALLPLEGDVVDGDAAGARSLGEPARGVVSRPVSLQAARPATSASAQNPCSIFFIAIPPLAVFRRASRLQRECRRPRLTRQGRIPYVVGVPAHALVIVARPRARARTKESRV